MVMNTMDVLNRWSMLSLDQIEEELTSKDGESAAAELLGEGQYEELCAITAEPETREKREAVVLLPGFMGSLLASIRGVTTLVWINPLLFVQGKTSYLEMDEAGQGDARPDIEIVPVGAEKLVYLKIALKLRRQVELYEFPYDWRRPIESNGDLLATYLERWAGGDSEKKFTLVGHSMGGIVSRAYMARHPAAAERRIKRAIMLGTPHFGAAGAVENLIMGNSMTSLADKLNDGNNLVSMVRNFPSVYQLMPAPRDLFPSHRPYPVNWDVYRASEWRVEGIRQDYLDAGRRFHEMMNASDPQVRLIEIAGCHIETLVDLARVFGEDERPEFDLTWKTEGDDSGDGTVPLWSAELPAADMYYLQEVHRDLPKNGEVIQATLELIHRGEPDLSTTLPEPKTGLFIQPMRQVSDEQARDLKQQIESGTVSEADLSPLYFGL
jgi:pimeloyl-ACP methyl ester carboxylesterase